MKLSVDMESVAGSHGTTCHHSPSGSSDQLNSFYLEPESDPPVPFSSSPVTSSPGCIITPSEASPREVDLNCKSELSNIMSHGPSMVLKRASETFSPSGITSVGTNLLGTEIYSILDDSDNGDAYSDVSGPAFICANSALSDPGQPAFVEELDALLRDVIKDQGLYQSGSSASVSPAQGGQYAAQDGDDTSPVDLKFAASGISNLVSSSPYQGGSVDNISKAMSVSLSPSSSMNVLEHLVLDSGCGSSSESSLFQAFGRDSQSGSFATVVLPTTDEPTSYPSIPGTGPRREAPSVLAEDPAPLGSGNVSLRTPSLSSLNKAVPLAPKKMLRHASLYHESRTPSIPCKRTALDVDPTRLLATGKTSNSESNHDAYMQGLALKAETNSSLAPIVPKKRKISRLRSEQKQDGTDGDTELAISTTSANDSHHFASKPASLRKAASLLSNPSPTQVHHSNKISSWLRSIKEEPESEFTMDAPIVQKDLTDSHMDTRTFPPGHPLYFPPTQPTTPIIEALSSSGRSSVITHSPLSPFASPLPIIAPPPYLLIPRAPHTVEGIAEEHIAMMLVKEQIERLNDNLPLLRDFRGAGKNSESKPQREVVDEDDCESTEEGEFDDEDSEMDYSSMNEHDSEREGNSQVSDDEGFSKNPVDVTVCIQEDFRREVVEWVLGLHPRPTKQLTSCPHLYEQLSSIPDARWHAAQLFTKYFIRIGMSSSSSQMIFDDSEAGFVWDVAVACIALSMKFHRDVLYPLYPILAEEFLTLAPHDMAYEDLETAQRELLSAFSFTMGSVTPSAYMQELWLALPSLRALLAQAGEWEAAQRAAWETLSDALLDIEYLRYPISVLTGCALVLGIVDTLVVKAKVNSAVALSRRVDKWRPRKGAKCDCTKRRLAAQQIAQNVEADIMDLLGPHEKCWKMCKQWLVELFA